MEIRKIKKRYIVGAVVIVFLLWRCSDSDEPDQAMIQQQRAADAVAQLANQEAAAAGQPTPYVQVAPQQPVVVQTQQPQQDHFWDYVMLHHLLNNNSQPQVVYHRQYQPRSRVTNVTNVTNVTHVNPAPVTQPAPKKSWGMPSTTARSYTVSAPAASSMKSRTWSTSSSKGWGSATSYKPSSSSYSFRSSSSSFRSSSFRGGRR
ncbi:hypothetical protein NF539_004859 [Escherichia coli]|nr:hypothetical protein [Escherichia coli]